ncbi:MAG: hypothetical protein ACTSP8_06955, partial [Promethearchaeota archaeon]
MKITQKTTLLLLVLSISFFGVGFLKFTTTTPVNEFPDYIPVDYNSSLAGKVNMPELSEDMGSYDNVYDFEDTPPVGTQAYDWYLSASADDPWMTLKWAEGNVEIWVQNEISFPDGDPRNDDPYNLMISDEMFEHLADEFNDNIYPKCTE